MGIRVRFYIRNRGNEDVFVPTFAGRSAEQIAAAAVAQALRQFNSRWPGAIRSKLNVIKAEYV